MAALKPELTGATGWPQPPQTRTIATHRWASLGLFPYFCPLCTIVQMRNLTKKYSLRRDLNRGSLVLKATTTASHHTNSFFLLTQINGMPDFCFFPNLTKRQNDETQTAELRLTEKIVSKPIFKKSNRSLKGYGFSFAAGINCGHLLVGGRFVRFRRQSHFWAASNYRCKI